jgi:hypothetical protein
MDFLTAMGSLTAMGFSFWWESESLECKIRYYFRMSQRLHLQADWTKKCWSYWKELL